MLKPTSVLLCHNYIQYKSLPGVFPYHYRWWWFQRIFHLLYDTITMVEELHRYLPEEELTDEWRDFRPQTDKRFRFAGEQTRNPFCAWGKISFSRVFFGIETNSFHIQEQTLERTKTPTTNLNMNLSQLVCSGRISSNKRRGNSMRSFEEWNVCRWRLRVVVRLARCTEFHDPWLATSIDEYSDGHPATIWLYILDGMGVIYPAKHVLDQLWHL